MGGLGQAAGAVRIMAGSRWLPLVMRAGSTGSGSRPRRG
jgi:hypothetical protein